MKFELIMYPTEIKPNTEYRVKARVTPGFFGLLTDDFCYFYEIGIPRERPIGRHKTKSRRTFIYRETHLNPMYSPYIIDAEIKPLHVSKLTEPNMSIGLAAYNGLGDPVLSMVFGGEGVRIDYEREGDIYYFTGEIGKSY